MILFSLVKVDVQRIHLPGQHRIIFDDGAEQDEEQLEELAEQADRMLSGDLVRRTQLTEYFALNRWLRDHKLGDVAANYRYDTIHEKYWWKLKTKEWKKRTRERKKKLVRIATAAPTNRELTVLVFFQDCIAYNVEYYRLFEPYSCT